jgi:hypothetical protein
MKLRMMAVAGALAGLAMFGCTSGSNAPTATGNPTTSQSGTIVGQITDVDAQSFNVKPQGGNEITLHRSAAEGNVVLKQGEQVRASYRVDTDGNKIAQSVEVLSAGNANMQNNAGGMAPSGSTSGSNTGGNSGGSNP